MPKLSGGEGVPQEEPYILQSIDNCPRVVALLPSQRPMPGVRVGGLGRREEETQHFHRNIQSRLVAQRPVGLVTVAEIRTARTAWATSCSRVVRGAFLRLGASEPQRSPRQRHWLPRRGQLWDCSRRSATKGVEHLSPTSGGELGRDRPHRERRSMPRASSHTARKALPR